MNSINKFVVIQYTIDEYKAISRDFPLKLVFSSSR